MSNQAPRLSVPVSPPEVALWTRVDMARRVARDIGHGWTVNLGIGIPTLVADHLPAERCVTLHSENGILGVGPRPANDPDPWIINAGKEAVTVVPGAAYIHHADSFAIIRGGHIDLSVMGAFEVAANGDLANWATDLGRAPAVGGAMDLAVGARNLWVMMEHVTRAGEPRLVAACGYPLTARSVVTRVYTDLATLDVTADGFVAREMAPGLTLEALQSRTGARVKIKPE